MVVCRVLISPTYICKILPNEVTGERVSPVVLVLVASCFVNKALDISNLHLLHIRIS